MIFGTFYVFGQTKTGFCHKYHCKRHFCLSPDNFSVLSDNYIFKHQIYSFRRNIFQYFHIENVNRNSGFFVGICNFMIFHQNIRFLYSYVNLSIHIFFMWIKWITLCITRFYKVFHLFKMWKTFVLKFVQSTFFDRLCAMCPKSDYLRYVPIPKGVS